MHRHMRKYVLILGCSLMLPACATTPPQTDPMSPPTATGSAYMRDRAPHICFDELFYAALPGKTNYCLGLRDWNNGRYHNGLELLKLAAGWGNKSAQYTLGLIYYGGHHVAADPALGIAWLKLADERHNDAQIALATRSASAWATPLQRKHGDQLFQKMRGAYGDRVATARAWHHLRHWERHQGLNAGTVCLYGQQLYAIRHAGIEGVAPPFISQAIQAAIDTKHGRGPDASAGAKAQVCVGVSLRTQRHMVQQSASTYFQGWIGIVTVGPLKTVPAPASSSSQ